jgi:hypothetical protein
VPRILQREKAGDIRGALTAARNALVRLPNHQNLRQITARLQIANGDVRFSAVDLGAAAGNRS